MRRLLIRPGAIGDLILSIPAMKFLRTEYLEVWAASQNLPLIRFADRTGSITASGLDMLGLPGQAPPPQLLDRLQTFDSIVSWYGENRAEFRQCVQDLALPFEFLRALPAEGEKRHAADFFLTQVGGKDLPAIPRIECPRGKGVFAVIHPFSGSAKKNWPLERFRALAERIQPVRWCAGPEEELEGAVRFENLYELACWLAQARVYIGNDSGISHLAAAVGTPVVALFGPTKPGIWAPRGQNVRIVQHESIEAISVDEVVAAIG